MAAICGFSLDVDGERIVFDVAMLVTADPDPANVESFPSATVVVAEQAVAVGEQEVELPELVERAQRAMEPSPVGFRLERSAPLGNLVQQGAKGSLGVGRTDRPGRAEGQAPDTTIECAVVCKDIFTSAQFASERICVCVARRAAPRLVADMRDQDAALKPRVIAEELGVTTLTALIQCLVHKTSQEIDDGLRGMRSSHPLLQPRSGLSLHLGIEFVGRVVQASAAVVGNLGRA